MDFDEAPPDDSEMNAGQSGPKLLIKSEPPEREARKRLTWKAPRKSDRKKI
ncbi:hypothetical protein [Streptomyces acidicola]|uniref:hypothetical protein n=1 Tax=Streptomyces acidicola TaxID=2596892 RepID=UPI00380B3FE0